MSDCDFLVLNGQSAGGADIGEHKCSVGNRLPNRKRVKGVLRVSLFRSRSPSGDQSPQQRAGVLLLHLLRRGAASTSELARAIGEPPRAVLTTLKQLAEVIAIEKEGDGRDTRWVLDPDGRHNVLGLDAQVALLIGRGLLAFAPPLQPELREDASLVRRLDRKFVVRTEPARNYSAHQHILRHIQRALFEERSLDIRYEGVSGKESHWPDAQPLSLVVHRRAVYLVADIGGTRAPRRALAVERIREVSVGGRVPYPSAWDPNVWLEGRWGIHEGKVERVHLRFDAAAAPYVLARTWPGQVRATARDDGGVDLHLRVGGRELRSWVLEWGASVEVVSPPDLRALVEAELARALSRYRPPAPSNAASEHRKAQANETDSLEHPPQS